MWIILTYRFSQYDGLFLLQPSTKHSTITDFKNPCEPGLKYTNLRPCVQIKLLKLMLMKELHLYNTVGI